MRMKKTLILGRKGSVSGNMGSTSFVISVMFVRLARVLQPEKKLLPYVLRGSTLGRVSP